MTYLAGQIFFCLLIAALIGGIIGWLLKSLAGRGRVTRLENDLESARGDYRAVVGEREGLNQDLSATAGKLREVEASLAATSGEKATLVSDLEDVRGKVSELEAALAAMTAERDEAAEAQASAAAVAGADGEALTALRAELHQAQGDLARCRDDLAAAAAAPTPTPAAAPVPLLSTPDEGEPARRDDLGKDDLERVEGIGPKIEELLNGGGIFTWAQLAAAPIERLQAILDAAGERYRIHDPATWPRQAQLAAAGRWDELEELQERLTGGRQD